MFKLDLEKAEEPEIKLPTMLDHTKSKRIKKNPFTSALLTVPKPLTVWITTNCGKFFKRWEYQTTLFTCLLRNLYARQEASQEGTVRTDHGKWTGSKLGKEYVKAVYCHPVYLTYMQSTS